MNKLNNFFSEKKSFKNIFTHGESPVLFLNFTIFLDLVGEKDGKIILFVEYGGHGPFLCGLFRSSVKVDNRAEAISQFIEVERFLSWISTLMLYVFPFLTSKQNFQQCSVNSSLKLLNLASVALLASMQILQDSLVLSDSIQAVLGFFR